MRWSLLCSTIIIAGCNPDRVAQLEKQNKELMAKLEDVSKQSSLDLQSKCAKQAREEFNSEGWRADTLAAFTNHYNKQLSKCFIEVTSSDTKTAGDGTIFQSTVVSDAFEGKTYGEYHWKSDKVKKYWEVPPFLCRVTSMTGQETVCHSDDEFKAAVKQYMEQ